MPAVGPLGEPKTVPAGDFTSPVDIPALNALALRSLVSLFMAKERLFSRRATFTKDGMGWERPSRKQTIIALLGIRRLAEAGGPQPFDVTAIRDTVLADATWVKSIEDLGLLTWFTAEFVPERLPGLINEFDFGHALEAYVDGRQRRTRGLTSLLGGIAHAQLANPDAFSVLADVAGEAYRLLQDNQGESALFGHSARAGLLGQVFCHRFGTFSDQIHSIYALTMFARAFQIEEPLAAALACANSLRALQGELGQWWFLYDQQTCRVVNHYPVYCLHQDGTAPLALLTLGEATGQSFHEPVYKGLAWVAGANELGDDLRNPYQGWIWDSVWAKGRTTNYWEAALSVAHISSKPHTDDLGILHEASPDHFGWLLYAFGRFGLSNDVAGCRSGPSGGREPSIIKPQSQTYCVLETSWHWWQGLSSLASRTESFQAAEVDVV